MDVKTIIKITATLTKKFLVVLIFWRTFLRIFFFDQNFAEVPVEKLTLSF